MVPTYEVGSSIDFAMKYARDARWGVVGRALEVLEGGLRPQEEHRRVAGAAGAGYGRALTVYDDQVGPGFTSKRLVELMKTVMRRRAGGNSTSVNRGKLTRLYMSPEALGDIRTWDLTEVDDFTRREIFLADEDGASSKVFGVEFRELDELGVGQEFQLYATDRLGWSIPTPTTGNYATRPGVRGQSKKELVVGLDLSKDDASSCPVRQEVEVFEDPTFHRQRRAACTGSANTGSPALDARRVLLRRPLSGRLRRTAQGPAATPGPAVSRPPVYYPVAIPPQETGH
jgi:hypothetical protein